MLIRRDYWLGPDLKFLLDAMYYSLNKANSGSQRAKKRTALTRGPSVLQIPWHIRLEYRRCHSARLRPFSFFPWLDILEFTIARKTTSASMIVMQSYQILSPASLSSSQRRDFYGPATVMKQRVLLLAQLQLLTNSLLQHC